LGTNFVARRVLQVLHRGNLANKMLQYMGALTLAARIRESTVVNVSLPEWGIDIPDDTHGQVFFDNVDLWRWDPFRPHVQELCAIANQSDSVRIIMGDHLQRMEFLMPPEAYKGIFPKGAPPSRVLTDKDLLINIRTAEILGGVAHYPVLPISFYEDVVARTELNPVFVGQLGDSEYVRRLRQRFPGAEFINSMGARADFDLIRSAKHIVVAVSTFSWLAAWLSDAHTIILPLTGFYNPSHHREIDLLPADDIRYRFFLFPLNYGLPEVEALEQHERIAGRWKEISANQVALLKTASPLLRAPRETYDSGLPVRMARGSGITFDSVWYAHRYIDAAMEISEGWFEDPLHHYLEIGRLRGYLPTRPIDGVLPPDATRPSLALGTNLALNKPATQSSWSQWSNGKTPEEDAANAVNGNPSKEFGFHTAHEQDPWWMVDLGSIACIQGIRIFNREGVPDWMQRRASPLVVEISKDKESWKLLFRTQPGQLFGGYGGGRPLIWSSADPVECRFVRISIPRHEALHLAEVEVYGTFLGDRAPAIEARLPQGEAPALAQPVPVASLLSDMLPKFHAEKVKRVLFFVGFGWAFGSVHSELVRYLHSRGIVADMLDWSRVYGRDEMRMMGEYYDRVVSIPGETWPLTDNHGIPHEKIVVIAHGDYDLRHALQARPREEFDRFGGFGVISQYLQQLSAELGIKRVPKVVKYGVNCSRFFTPVASELKVVGYGGSMERKDHEGVDWKRGHLAKEATEAAGLVFNPAGQYHFLAMPQYYRQVDAVLVTSLNEGFGLPAIEAAAAGRLVISTPVGGFPYLASLGGGITAPVDAQAYREFVTESLSYYRNNPKEYVQACENIRASAKRFDWEHTIDQWIELVENGSS